MSTKCVKISNARAKNKGKPIVITCLRRRRSESLCYFQNKYIYLYRRNDLAVPAHSDIFYL